ncbi:MAG: hypothetical protein Q9227_000764 [Pyrenula ochraceoflavens]
MTISVEITNKPRRSRQWLTKGGLARDDSDDELGVEDYPWEWIYKSESAIDNFKDEEKTPTRKRKASALTDVSNKPQIIGARMGKFSCKIGDAVLLKSPEEGKDWAALICGFSEANEDDEDEMSVNVMWFVSPEEFGKKEKRRSDVVPNEQYITADFNMNPLTAINGTAKVMSCYVFQRMYPEGKVPKKRAALAEYRKTVVCRRGVKQRTSKYTEEFLWEDIYHGAEDLLGLIDRVKAETKSSRKRAGSPDPKTDTEYSLIKDMNHGDDLPSTPKKRRKTASVSATPTISRKSNKFITPTHKRITIKKPLEITPLGTRILSPTQLFSSPYARARTTLHVSAVPPSLPCRTTEFETVYSHLSAAISDGTGSCIYISGTPGTGKTATVREVISSLTTDVHSSHLEDFTFVEINGMKLTDPHQSYSLLWEALKGDRVSPAHALELLQHDFSHPSPRRIPCVVLMDELDQLVTKTQSVMYNFFNWPALRHSRLIVLAVANTMDLPERTLSNKISSRLGLTRITFPGYTHTQLMQIIGSRLEGVPGNIVEADAIQFASRKVAAVSGDARRALDICRRAVEIAEQAEEEREEEDGPEDQKTPSKTPGKKRHADKEKEKEKEKQKQKSKVGPIKVTISTIKQAINEATSSPMAQYLRSLPLAAKLFLAAMLARSRRTGVAEASLGDVISEAKKIADLVDSPGVREFLLARKERGGGEGEGGGGGGGGKKTVVRPRVLAMGGAAMELQAAGVVAVEARARGQRNGKIRLRIGEEEVRSALMGDVEVKGMGFSA